MSPAADPLSLLCTVNERAAFNRWCGFEVQHAAPGEVELAMPWREELGQYSGFLHAGIVGALIDTACGFAAASQLGARVMASHFAVNCLRPAVGERFVAKARVLRAGRQQVFTRCELYAHAQGQDRLVATGETLLCVVDNDAAA
ncbi:MAG TPA: PaaI family thioesterase [Burkholderiaceae bacterium]|nr:PaaI family thioesterase [Burkholderiaceae bacterium]